MLIKIDWLQYSCHLTNASPNCKINKYVCIKQKYNTKIFKNVYIGYLKDIEYFTITCNPHSPALDKDLCIIKLNNKLLYTTEPIALMNEILDCFDLKFRSITRLDICHDFIKFENELYPDKFILNFVSNKYLKKEDSKVKVHFTHTTTNEFETISFGAASSNVTYKLYNKSKELNEAVLKPYIFEYLENLYPDAKSNFWRLEFTINNSSTIYMNDAGEILYHAKSIDFLTPERLRLFYELLLNKYFVFVINNNLSRKDRMPQVELFKIDKYKPLLYLAKNTTDSTRADKIFLKKLNSIGNELRHTNMDMAFFTYELLNGYADNRGLVNWQIEKIPESIINYNPMTRQVDEIFKETYKTRPKKNF